MHRTPAESAYQGAVQYRAVSFVEIKTILGIFFVEPRHDAIPRYFCDNGCRGDHRNLFIAFNDGLLRDAIGEKKPAVKKYVRGGA